MRILIYILLFIFTAILPVLALPPSGWHDRTAALKVTDNDVSTYFDGNQILMFVTNNGTAAMDQGALLGRSEGFYYPYNGDTSSITSGEMDKTVMFAAGLVLCGKVDGEIRTAVAAYDYPEFVPGPMAGGSYLADQPSFRVYKIDSLSGPGDADYDEWPADDGAPVDQQGNPVLRGDQMLWAVFNDADSLKHDNFYGGGTGPLGVEVQQSVWGMNDPGEGEVLYLKYKLYNRGENQIDSFYISFWADPDLGTPNDDRAGCDTLYDLFYCYNNSDSDLYYGSVPPAWGGAVVSGPVVPSPGDTADFDGSPLPGYRNIGMSSFIQYVNGTEPDTPEELMLYARGWNAADKTPMINPVTGDTTAYFAPGNPLRNKGWIDDYPSDKRIMVSFGPFSFNPGDSQQVVLKIGAYAERDRLFSLSVLKHLLDETIAIDSVMDTVTYVPADSVRLLILDFGLESVRFLPLKERWLTGYEWGGHYYYGGADYGSEFFGSSISIRNNPTSFHSVEVRFSRSVTQKAYRYERTDNPESPYPYAGYATVPFTVWDIDNDRQLNAGFVEYPSSNVYDLTWGPDYLQYMGGYEYLFIFSSDYDGENPSHDGPIDYTQYDILDTSDSLDVMYALWPVLMDGSSLFQLDDGQKLVFDGQFINYIGFLDTLYFRDCAVGESDEQIFVVQSFADGPAIYFMQTSDPGAFTASSPLLRFLDPEDQRTSIVFHPYRGGDYNELLYVVDSASGELLKAVQLIAGSPTPTAVDEEDSGIVADGYSLWQNYPNPFNPSTTISYELPRRSEVKITVYNLLGREVRELVSEIQPAGRHSVVWDGANKNGKRAASGLYFYRIVADEYVNSRKMIMLK